MSEQHIVIVDDDERLCRLLSRYLERSGYAVSQANTGSEMRSLMAEKTVDLYILDVMLDGEDGLQLAQEIRSQNSRVPIMMLSARAELSDRVIGLELGADDYLTKPFEEVELLARVRSLLRRAHKAAAPSPGNATAYFSGWALDLISHTLTSADDKKVDLTSFEYQVLALLVSKANTAISREEILQVTTNREWTPFDRTVDVVMAKLRKKIEVDSKHPSLIKTIRNAGYQLTANVDYSESS